MTSIWNIPLKLAAVTGVALTTALFFDGATDVVSALLLLLPSMVLLIYLYRSRRT